MTKIATVLSSGAAAILLPLASTNAQVSFQLIGRCLATDISADGSVVVGNTVDEFETFRWTLATGIVPLGRVTAPVLGVGAGTPDVSWDGTRISATILDDTGSFATQGRWIQGLGWQQLMPPAPTGGGVADLTLSSAWGISGDGLTVSGHFSRPGQTGGFVHASQWTQANGAVDLGSDGKQSSGRGANYDGSVIVGWDEHPSFGNRRPALWVNGVKTVLTPNNDGPSELAAASADGKMVVGSNFNFPANHEEAAIWRFTGGNWVVQDLGALLGTSSNGLSVASDVSADGSIVVGFNRFNSSNFLNATGFIWTPSIGLISAQQFLSNNGITLPPDFQILDLSAVSADGSTIVGIGVDLNTFESHSFLINIPEPGGLCLLGLALPLFARRRSGRATALASY